MKTCERCGVELFQDHWESVRLDSESLHTDARCADRLKTQRDEALARVAKLEASVQTQTVASFPDAARVRELEIILAESSGASAEMSKIFHRTLNENDALRSATPPTSRKAP